MSTSLSTIRLPFRRVNSISDSSSTSSTLTSVISFSNLPKGPCGLTDISSIIWDFSSSMILTKSSIEGVISGWLFPEKSW